jgi:alpha-D-ribose 1-methylphosphonate 5-triphosphate diphosphatase
MWLSDLRVVLPDRVPERASIRLERGRIREVRESGTKHADLHSAGLHSAGLHSSGLHSSGLHSSGLHSSGLHGAGLHGAGLVAIPGLVDLHGDMLEREIEPCPGTALPIEMTLLELDKRLAASGVTTAFAAISFSEHHANHLCSQERASEIVEGVHALRGTLLTDIRVHARFEITNPRTAPVLKDLLERGMVDLVSLNDHTPGQGQYRDLERFVQYVSEWQGNRVRMSKPTCANA